MSTLTSAPDPVRNGALLVIDVLNWVAQVPLMWTALPATTRVYWVIMEVSTIVGMSPFVASLHQALIVSTAPEGFFMKSVALAPAPYHFFSESRNGFCHVPPFWTHRAFENVMWVSFWPSSATSRWSRLLSSTLRVSMGDPRTFSNSVRVVVEAPLPSIASTTAIDAGERTTFPSGIASSSWAANVDKVDGTGFPCGALPMSEITRPASPADAQPDSSNASADNPSILKTVRRSTSTMPPRRPSGRGG